MQHIRGICSFLKALLLSAVLATAPVQAQGTAEYPHRMKLAADGKLLTLMLKESRVTQNLSVYDASGNPGRIPVKTLIGKIQGDPQSWVRLTQSNNRLDGVISRFGKRFRLQKSGSDPVQIQPLADNHDKRITLTKSSTRNRANGKPLGTSKVTHVAKIAIVVDSQFNAKHNGNGLAYALSLINSVDGIYREEFGLALQVEHAVTIADTNTDPFNLGKVPVETMLRHFRDYRMQSTVFDQNISLVHLFTGNTPADEPVGLAWIDTACRTDGYDVGLSTPYRHDILLVAHEIAHNLGALHDSDTQCSMATDKVMWPYISAGTSQQFSSCTIDTVKRRVKRSCHAPATDLELASLAPVRNTIQAANSNEKFIVNPVAALAKDFTLCSAHHAPGPHTDTAHDHAGLTRFDTAPTDNKQNQL